MQVMWFVLILAINVLTALEIDPNGYLVYCPCMGRFGNQADHFLGSLVFAMALNRTLILPPWVEYHKGNVRSIQIPFDKYFQIEPLKEVHRVVLMAEFMEKFANEIWPSEKRISFCYMQRKGVESEQSQEPDCHAKYGNPFGSFWDTFNISFVGSEFYGPLHFDVHHTAIASKWQEAYPAEKWPVLAFTGAPATFPIQEENRSFHRYLKWSHEYDLAARVFIKQHLPPGAFVGIHLRNGIDWVRACEHTRDSHQLFASSQCLGYHHTNTSVYPELCMPSKEIIVRQLKRLIKNVNQAMPKNPIHSIFVASDANHMISELQAALARMNVSVIKQSGNDPHLDLVILGLSNHFIGNCVSSYSGFVKRERDAKGLPSYFWAYPLEKARHAKPHEEL